MPSTYPMVSTDRHLDVLPGRWTSRIPKRYRDQAPTTTQLPDGSNAIAMADAGPFKLNYADLRGGRKGEEFQPTATKAASW